MANARRMSAQRAAQIHHVTFSGNFLCNTIKTLGK